MSNHKDTNDTKKTGRVRLPPNPIFVTFSAFSVVKLFMNIPVIIPLPPFLCLRLTGAEKATAKEWRQGNEIHGVVSFASIRVIRGQTQS